MDTVASLKALTMISGLGYSVALKRVQDCIKTEEIAQGTESFNIGILVFWSEVEKEIIKNK